MIKRFRNIFLLYLNYLYETLAVVGGAWVLGMVLTGLSINFSKTPPKSGDAYVSFGIIVAALVGVFVICAAECMFFPINFNIAVSMGISRRVFLLNSIIVILIQNVIYAMTFMVLGKLELVLGKLFYKQLDFAVADSVINGELFSILMGVSVAIIAVGLLLGALLHRFGKTAFWIMWGTYMIVAFGGVGFTNLVKTKSGFIGNALSQVIVAMQNITATGMLTFAAILCTIIAGIGLLLFRKASVK